VKGVFGLIRERVLGRRKNVYLKGGKELLEMVFNLMKEPFDAPF